jgi:hypothetical protein
VTKVPRANVEKKSYPGRSWLIGFSIFVYAPLGRVLGDMLFICAIYGREAYFDKGLYIIKHKPFTLSTGPVLSENLSTLCALLEAVIWISLVLLTVAVLDRLYPLVKSLTRRKNTTARDAKNGR